MSSRPWTGAEIMRASRLWKDGRSVAHIATALNRSEASVAGLARHHRDAFPRRQPGGNQPIDITAAIGLKGVGLSNEKIAEKLGASKNGVQKALQRHRETAHGLV